MQVPDGRPERWQALDGGWQVPPICVKDRTAKYQCTSHLPTSPPRPSPSLGSQHEKGPRAQNAACQRNKTPQPRGGAAGAGGDPRAGNPTPGC